MTTLPHPLAGVLDSLRARLEAAREDRRFSSTAIREETPAVLAALPHLAVPRQWRDRVDGAAAVESAVAAASVETALTALLDATVEPGAPAEVRTNWGARPPDREWLIDGWLPAGRLGLLSGEGGRGKSTLAVQLLAAIAGGRRTWLPGSGLSLSISNPAPVVLWSAEDEGDEVARRLHRIRWHEGVGDRLHYLDGAASGPLWAPAGASGHVSTRGALTPQGAWVRAYAEAAGAVLLVLDAAASAYACDENARGLVREHCASWDAWGREHGCAVMLISHPPKSGSSYSGSTDWHAAARWRWVYDLKQIPMAGDDDVAPQLALPKGNYAPPGTFDKLWIGRNWSGPWVGCSPMAARDLQAGRVDRVTPEFHPGPARRGQRPGHCSGV